MRLFMRDYRDTPDLFFHLDKCALVEDFPVHDHDFAELVVVLKGTAIHVLDGKTHRIGAGSVFVVDRNQGHGYRNVDKLYYFNLMFDGSRLPLGDDLKKLPGFQSALILDERRLRQVEATLDGLLDEYNRREPGFSALIQLHLSSLFLNLARWHADPPSAPLATDDRIAATAAYLDTHFLEPLTLAALAERACLSPRQLLRVFRRAYGTTPIDHVIAKRLEHACGLLADPSNRVGEVALASGFDDTNYFSRRFRRTYGVSPTRYRATGKPAKPARTGPGAPSR